MDYGQDETSKTPMDPPEDTFRITLVCTLLDTVRVYLTATKKMKKRVERFLAFLQKYILSKNYLPMLLEFMVLDIFEYLNPNLVIFKSLKEATDACNKIIQVLGRVGSKFMSELGRGEKRRKRR